MNISPYTTNYSNNTNNNVKTSLSVKPKIQNSMQDTVSFKGFPVMRNVTEKVWNISGKDILSASKKEIRTIAEHLHKHEEIPEDIYKVEKETFFGLFTKKDEFKTGAAYQKLANEIEAVRETRKTASKEELKRLDEMAQSADEKLSRTVSGDRIVGFV